VRRAEAWASISLAGPLMASFLSQNFINIVNMIFLGHLEERYIAASSLALMYCNVFGISLTMGLSAAVDTLGSQAFGARNYMRVGLVTQRVTVLAILMMIPLLFGFWFSGSILQIATIKEDIAVLAQGYIRVCMPGLIGNTLMDITRRYMEAQGKFIISHGY
jgi:MATE family multidrug resistance protein